MGGYLVSYIISKHCWITVQLHNEFKIVLQK